MKKKMILASLIPIILLSCNKQNLNHEAYCFSIVFDRIDNISSVTMYCKTNSQKSDDMIQIPLNFRAEDFTSAFSQIKLADYNIYLNSISAYYFSGNLTEKDKFEITLLLLNNSKYKTDNKIYCKKDIDITELHIKASDVCDYEGIKKAESNNYKNTLYYLKDIFKD